MGYMIPALRSGYVKMLFKASILAA